MEIIRVDDYFSCVHDKKQARTPFRILQQTEGHRRTAFECVDSTIIFLLEGSLTLFFDNRINQQLQKGQMLLLPVASRVEWEAIREVYAIVCSFESREKLCQNFGLSRLLSLIGEEDENFYPLAINERLGNYLTLMKNYMEDGYYCPHFYELKLQELFFVFRVYYEQTELALFFRSILNKDIFFKDGVLKNYAFTHTVAELAHRMNYSQSGFKKKFKRIFGQSPSAWIQRRRAAVILRELKENRKSLKDIAYQHHFSSDARFYEFCKRHYGKAPGAIRKEK
ncbi:MAG: helix-turn-helix transcriptional regulator [Dysgonamonadaceae bacterium]|jgi:AraC-like DNA-binding protein|nr:helix-turn-helix transcriptional regulator [Dysgonamonadaceae bacterium]